MIKILAHFHKNNKLAYSLLFVWCKKKKKLTIWPVEINLSSTEILKHLDVREFVDKKPNPIKVIKKRKQNP